MTENCASDSTPTASTAGGLLKAARQSVGMHLAVLSVNLKVPVRQLEALEADQYPVDQSPVFARGLAARICRPLRVDPAPILALMPMSGSARRNARPFCGRRGCCRKNGIAPGPPIPVAIIST